MINKFYVYILFDYNGVPRYVGKGCGQRDKSHELLRDTKNTTKNEFISTTLRMRGEVPKIRIREHLSEKEAYRLEILLIKAIGRSCNSKGPLTNIAPGGVPSLLTAEERSQRTYKANASRTPEQRSEAIRKGNKTRELNGRPWNIINDSQKRSKRAKKAWSTRLITKTSEEISKAASKAAKSLTFEQRSQAKRNRPVTSETRQKNRENALSNPAFVHQIGNIKQYLQSLTTEELSDRGKRAWKDVSIERRKEISRKANEARWHKP